MPIVIEHDGVRYYGFIDVSAHQMSYTGAGGKLRPGAITPDLRKAAARGIAGGFARIGNGTSFDQSFPHFHSAANVAGLPWGAYYYAQPNVLTGAAAAARVGEWLVPYPLELPVMLDLEAYYGDPLSPGALADWMSAFLEGADRLTPNLAILYAGRAYVNSSTLSGSFAARTTVQPRYPRNGVQPPSDLTQWATWIPWGRTPGANAELGRWDAWQFSSDAHWPDFGAPPDANTNRLDVNIVPVDLFDGWVATSTPPPPPPPPTPPPTDITWRTNVIELNIVDPPTARIVDTREGIGFHRPAVGAPFRIDLPDGDHAAAILQVTAVGAAGPGHVTLYGAHEGATSHLNYSATDPSPQCNTTIVPVGRDAAGPYVAGKLHVNSADLVIDLLGTFTVVTATPPGFPTSVQFTAHGTAEVVPT